MKKKTNDNTPQLMGMCKYQKSVDSVANFSDNIIPEKRKSAGAAGVFLRSASFSDGVYGRRHKIHREKSYDLPLARFVERYKNSSVLFSKYGKTENFSTDNLQLHFIKSDREPNFLSVDGFINYQKRLPVRYAVKNRQHIYAAIQEKYGDYGTYFKEAFARPFEGMSTVKMWNVSIVGSLVVGMFLMTFIYRYLGQGAAADVMVASNMAVSTQQILDSQVSQVLGADTEKKYDPSDSSQVVDYVSQIMQNYQNESHGNEQLAKEIYAMVGDTPMKQMVPYISQQNGMVAAFMVGIAKQESSWGVHVPVDPEGNDCFNYWGYRGKNPIGTGGHSCFASPQDAVDTVAKRLSFLVSSEKLTTPGEMVVVWKCGYDCSWDKPAAVANWVDAVNYYFQKFDEKSDHGA